MAAEETCWQDFIFGAKCELPDLGDPYVARPRLNALLDRATRKRLTAVIAGEGAGKTTTIAAYLRSRPAESFVWYSTDSLDESATDMLRGLLVALGGCVSTAGEDLQVLANIVAAVKRRGGSQPLLLAIDEVQLAPAPALALLLRYLPRDVRLLLAGRAIPAELEDLVGWYRHHNQLARVDAADLTLDPDETLAFARAYQQAAPLPWPGSFTVNLVTADYVGQRVLPAIADAWRRVVAMAAGLERFTLPQFQVLVGEPDVAAMLDYLVSCTPLLTRRGEYYEWAPGVAQALLGRLSEDERSLAHQRAGDVLAASSPLAAARAYVAAGAFARAAQSLMVVPSWSWARLPAAAADLVRAIPLPILADHPSLLLAQARHALMSDSASAAHALLTRVKPDSSAEQVELLALRARAIVAMGQAQTLDTVRGELRAMGERLRGIDGDAAANALAQAGTLSGLLGRPAEAVPLLQQALGLLDAGAASPQQHYLLAFVLTSLGGALVSQGEPRAALPILERAVVVTREQGDEGRLDEAVNNLAMGYMGLGQWAKAALLLQERLDDESSPRPPALRAFLADSLADVCLANGEAERAIRLCHQVLSLVATGDPYERAVRARTKLVLLLVERGLLIEARQQYLALIGDGGGAADALSQLAHGALLLAEGHPDEAVVALKIAAAVDGYESIDMVRAHLWLARAHLRSGDHLSAKGALMPLAKPTPAALGAAEREQFADVLNLLGRPAPSGQVFAPTVVHALRREDGPGTRPARLEIRLLGAPQLIVDGDPVEFSAWTYRRALELFCYLVARRKPVRRDEILAHVLPDIEPANARPALSSALSKMRKTIRQTLRFPGDPVIVDDHDRCQLDLAALADRVSVDVDELDAWGRDVRHAAWAGPVAPLLRLTDGEFLEGYDGEWLVPYRRAYGDIAELALEHALSRCEASGRLQDALTLAERLVALDPEHRQATERLRTLRRAVAIGGGVAAPAERAS